MGQEVSATVFSREERLAYRAKMQQNLDVFERMLEQSRFDFTRPQMGLEIELNLVDAEGYPALVNEAVLRDFADDEFQSEVGRFNIEMNVPPRPMAGDQPRRLERWLSGQLHRAADVARTHDARVVAVGIVPTLQPEVFHGEWVSSGLRYAGLDQLIVRERGEGGMELDIEGPTGERIVTFFDSIGPLSACTSVQLHQQVTPQDFPTYWNAASAISGLQVAVGANSPYLFGRRLWAETRIPLFTQMCDTRSPQLKYQGVRPRAYFGGCWITSIFDLFEENVRCFPPLFHEVTDEDPVAVLDDDGVPELGELRLHNGTVWRWNRPIYQNAGGVPHLRVENRVLPAGPTPVDMVANACLYYGLLEKLTSSGRPIWTKMPFEDAVRNFEEGALRGIDATVSWPGLGRLPATELVGQHLLSYADEGLAALGLRREVRDAYLDVIAKRCERRVNGASWQVATTERFETAGYDRPSALAAMFELYIEHSDANLPVHEWPVPDVQPATTTDRVGALLG